MRNILIVLLLAISLVLPAFAAAEVVVIVHKDNHNPVDEQFVAKAFLGSVARWPSHGGIIVVGLPDDHPDSRQFYAKVLHKSPAAVRDVWSNNYFTGRSGMPKEAATDEEAKRLVAGNRNAIGYIDAAAVDASVKVVLRIP